MDQLASKARQGDQMIRFAFRQAADVLAMGLSRLMTIHGPMPLTATVLPHGWLTGQNQLNARFKIAEPVYRSKNHL